MNAGVRPGSLRAWAAALRPGSLPIALSPVLVGAALALLRQGQVDTVAALLVLAAALLMQLVTNLQNDVGGTLRGGDRDGTRTGQPRATARGWLGVRQVRRAIVATALLGAAVGLALVAWRGWPVLVVGSASLAAALAYMGGPRPIAYTPFGELTVLLFFGLVAVTGTDWVLTGSIGAASWPAALAVGALAAAALAINNHRDRVHDGLAGRRTFAVRFGAPASQRLFATLLAGGFVPLPAVALAAGSAWLLLPLLAAPSAWRLHRDFLRCPPGAGFNGLLFRGFRLVLVHAALLAAGALAARLAR